MKHTVTEHKLSSGAQGLLVDVPGSPVVNIVVRFNSGYQFGDRSHYEVPHVMEHLIGCGSKRYPGPNEFKVEITKNGAFRNAYTSADYNGYVIECAAFELPRILDLLEEYLTEPLFPQDAVETELSNVREELTRNTTEHSKVCSLALSEQSFPQEIMGFEERLAQLPQITREHVVEHYRRTHTAGNARFYLAGDFAGPVKGQILMHLERLFAKLPAGLRLQPREEPGLGLTEPVVTKRDIAQLYYSARLYAGELAENDRRALRLLQVLLFGGFASRVYGEARRRGLAYHIGGSAGAGPGSSSFGIGGYVTAENVKPLMELVAREFKAAREGNISADELGAAKDLVLGSLDRSHQTAGDILSFYLGYYDSEEKIVLYKAEKEAIRDIKLEQIAAAAQFMAAGNRHGTSWLGAMDAVTAKTYEHYLALIWE